MILRSVTETVTVINGELHNGNIFEFVVGRTIDKGAVPPRSRSTQMIEGLCCSQTVVNLRQHVEDTVRRQIRQYICTFIMSDKLSCKQNKNTLKNNYIADFQPYKLTKLLVLPVLIITF